MIAWIFGILSGLYFKIGIALFLVLNFIFYILKRKSKYLKLFYSKKIIIISLVCFIISYFQIINLEKSFSTKYKFKEPIEIVGTIISNPSYKEYKTVYIIQVESINKDNTYKNTKLLLNIKENKNIYAYGNKVYIIGEFEEPNTRRNEGGFDYKQYLKTKNIYGIIKVKTIKLERENNINIIYKLANEIANKIQEQANKLLDKKQASTLTALLIGNKENLEENIKSDFRKSNLSHMLAISGAHISYIIMGIGIIISKIKISKKTGKIITIILLLFFVLITGQTLAVTRACIMSIYLIIGSLFHKRTSILSSISISMLILLILNPYSIFDSGLQLSYGGTIGIVAIFPIIKKYLINKEDNKLKIYIKEMICITLSANIVIIPIILYHYNTLSLTFLISNLLASGIMGILVILGFITIILSFIFIPIGKILSIPLSLLLNLFLNIATFVSKLPFSQIYLATPKLSIIIIYYFLLLILIFYQKIKQKPKKRKIEKILLNKLKKVTKKNLIFLIFIIIIFILFTNKIPQNLKIHFIDIGQGDSTLIISPNKKTILIDGGGSKTQKTFDVGKQTLIPYILDKGITKIDYIIVSHFDSDYSMTYPKIAKNIDILSF